MAFFKDWIVKATAKEIKDLALMAFVDRALLYKLGTKTKTSNTTRKVGVAVAARLELAIKRINNSRLKKNEETLPEVTRGDLCRDCSLCPFYKESKNINSK